jgi:KipI family sensor histidine kinase inhibitor
VNVALRNITMLPLTDSSILLPLGDRIDPALNRRAHALTARLAEHPLEGVLETVPAYASLTVHYDPLLRTHAEVAAWLASHLATQTETAPPPARTIEIPVIYDGPDLAFVAEHCHLSIPEIIHLHSAAEYTVAMMGFLPGFPYLGGLPQELHVPRRASPRTHVPAGSVAIAGAQAGIYPQESPGGWQLLGRTDIPLYDPQREPPFLLAPGDKVRFVTDKS